MFIYVNNKLLYSQSAQPAQSWQSGQAFSASRNVPNHQVEHTTSNVLGANLYINIVRRTVRQGLFKELTLLKDINLTIQAGEMVLILGGSGAGKTTFMNAVMGYEKATGTIRHGDIDIYSQYNKMKYAIGFVPQDVLLRESDTVYDTLFNAATMKMPSGTTREMMAQRVETVMNMVSLSHVANSLIKSISGGEKKRVSAGVELVADPSLFFLDEPDSGLDAQSATELMENLRNIADAGKIVMIISHSPDRAAHLFNKVIVLAKSQVDNSGHLVFFGSVPDTEAFFGVNSLEGVVGKINRRDGQVEQYIARWKQISSNNNY
jgi:ABC-type multidrug transport system ATPase subunit